MFFPIVTRLYALLLRLYPHRFRAEFADEMQVVFVSTLADAAERGVASLITVWLREMRDMPGSLLREHLSVRHCRKEEATMIDSIEGVNRPGKPRDAGEVGSWKDAAIGALPFLVFGLMSMVAKIDSLPIHGGHPFLVFYLFAIIGLGVGWAKGFPRWSYAYFWWALVFAWWWTDMHTYGLRIPGYTFRDEPWGWRIWLPLAVVVAAAALWTRSLHPIWQLVTGFWQDWTWLSFGGYVLLAQLVLLADENHNPFLFALMAASTLVMAAGAWGYLRGAQTWRRVLALLAGFGLSAIIGAIDSATWDWRTYYGAPPPQNASPYAEMLRVGVAFGFWALMLFSPAVLGLVRRVFGPRRVA